MSSSLRGLRAGQPRWSFSRQAYKSGDPFCEPGLFSILVLACGRPWVTWRSLRSTAKAVARYPGEVEWIFVENGGNRYNLRLFERFPAERKVIVRQDNYGINEGLNQAWAL